MHRFGFGNSEADDCCFASRIDATELSRFTYIEQTASPQRNPRLRCAASHSYIAEGPA